MKIFTLEGATHYCKSFQPGIGEMEQSPREFIKSRLGKGTLINEGTFLFDEYRACSLRDAERSLFLAASHYRRAHDLMIPSSSHWAHVTLYYGAWFAAHALLAMFGCSVVDDSQVIEVELSSPGNQRLRRKWIGNNSGQYYIKQKGSHRRFWEAFYKSAINIKPLADIRFSASLTPISNNDLWLIDRRNTINYNVARSVASNRSFGLTFSEANFPSSLPGELNTQFSVCEGIMATCCSFSQVFGLATDALDATSPPASISQRVADLIYCVNIPDIIVETKRMEVFGN